MNIFEFVEQETDYKVNRKCKVKLLKYYVYEFEKILNEEEDIEKFCKYFKNISFLLRSTDEEDINNVNNSNEEILYKILNTDINLFSCKFDEKKTTIFPYMGSKRNWKETNNIITEELLKYGKKSKIVFELFLGAGNVIFDNLHLYKKYGIEKLILNDMNPIIISTFENIKNYKEEVLYKFSKIIFDIKNINNKINLDFDIETKQIQKYLHKEINDLIENNIFNCRTTALFLLIQQTNFGGKIDYDIKKNKLYSSFRNQKKYYCMRVYTLICNKIEFYNKALNIIPTEFHNEDYNLLIEDLKGEEVFINSDSPYYDSYNYSRKKYEDENFANCFNQHELLFHLSQHKGNYIYWNNENPLIYYYSTTIKNTDYEVKNLTYSNSKKENKDFEIIMNRYYLIMCINDNELWNDYIDIFINEEELLNDYMIDNYDYDINVSFYDKTKNNILKTLYIIHNEINKHNEVNEELNTLIDRVEKTYNNMIKRNEIEAPY